MTREEKIAELKAQIAELEAQPWPVEYGTAFALSSNGDVSVTYYSEVWNEDILKQGNLFRTREEAERERDRRAEFMNEAMIEGFDQQEASFALELAKKYRG